MNTAYVSFSRVITLIEDFTKSNGKPMTMSIKYGDIEILTKYQEVKANFCQGDYKRRVSQMAKIGFKIKKIDWQGEKPHDNTQVIFCKKEGAI